MFTLSTMRQDTCDVHAINDEVVRRVRNEMPPDEDIELLAETFDSLGDPTRARIIYALSRHELCVCDLADLLGISASAISHQLRLLRQMRLVKCRRDGKMAFYSLDDQHIVNLFLEGLRHVQEK